MRRARVGQGRVTGGIDVACVEEHQVHVEILADTRNARTGQRQDRPAGVRARRC